MKKKFMLLTIIIFIVLLPYSIFAWADEIKEPSASVPTEISGMTSDILGAIQWAGYAIAVGMVLYIGIKYILAAANERAELKQSAINWVIGAVIVVSVTTLFDFVINVIDGDDQPGKVENPPFKNFCNHQLTETSIISTDYNIMTQMQEITFEGTCTKCGKKVRQVLGTPHYSIAMCNGSHSYDSGSTSNYGNTITYTCTKCGAKKVQTTSYAQ